MKITTVKCTKRMGRGYANKVVVDSIEKNKKKLDKNIGQSGIPIPSKSSSLATTILK